MKFIKWLMWVLSREKHDFDLDNPVSATAKGRPLAGFKCKKCGKVLWLSRNQITDLPGSMKYCENMERLK
jgi:hypothetical protein